MQRILRFPQSRQIRGQLAAARRSCGVGYVPGQFAD
jgi:hypothetical protein